MSPPVTITANAASVLLQALESNAARLKFRSLPEHVAFAAAVQHLQHATQLAGRKPEQADG